MASRVRSSLTYANVMATIALCLTLGGGAYAATQLPRNSVGSKQLKSNAVSSSKVKDRSLRAADFGSGQLPRGARGARGLPGTNGTNGTPGTNGAPGEPVAHARIDPDGTLHDVASPSAPSQAKGITDANIEHTPGSGIYCFGGMGFTPHSAMVSLDNGQVSPLSATNQIVSVGIQRGASLGSCGPNFQQARVVLTQVDQTNAPVLVDGPYTVWFEDD